MNKKFTSNVIALTADALILNQCARMVDTLGCSHRLVGRLFDSNAQELDLSFSDVEPLKDAGKIRDSIAAFIRKVADDTKTLPQDMGFVAPQIYATLNRSDWAILQPIHYMDNLLAVACVFPEVPGAMPLTGVETLPHIGAQLFWLVRLAGIQHGSGLNEVCSEDVYSPFMSENHDLEEVFHHGSAAQSTSTNTFSEMFPVLGKLIGRSTFAGKGANTIRGQSTDRLLGITVIRIYVNKRSGEPVEGTLQMELLDNVLSRLSTTMRGHDLLCYLPNGDFAMMVSPIPAVALADSIFSRLLGAVTQSVVRDSKLYDISYNAGIVLVKGNTSATPENVRDYTTQATLLMESAIAAGKNHKVIQLVNDDSV